MEKQSLRRSFLVFLACTGFEMILCQWGIINNKCNYSEVVCALEVRLKVSCSNMQHAFLKTLATLQGKNMNASVVTIVPCMVLVCRI